VLIGISGGIDSTALLFVLTAIGRSIPFELGLAHVNHLLRGEESARDEEFVRDLGRRFSCPFYVDRVDVRREAEQSGKSIQHAARDLRYGFFQEVARKNDFHRIAVAHTLDDQVETFFLRTLKGTGIRGLSAIPIQRGKIIRPFLHVYKSEIEAYARESEVPFVEDSSNAKVVYERNFLRQRILPVMMELNPAFREKVVSLLDDLTAVNEVFDEKARAIIDRAEQSAGGDTTLLVEYLKGVDRETRFRVLAGVLERTEPSFIPLREHIRLVERIIGGKGPNLSVTLPLGVVVRKSYGTLIFTKGPFPAPVTETFPISLGENRIEPLGLTLSVTDTPGRHGMWPEDRMVALLDGDRLGDLSLRTYRNGDRFFPLGMRQSVKLKDFFIASKVPRDQRRRVPLLISGEDIAWIVGYRIDERYKVRDHTKRVLKVEGRDYPVPGT